MFFIDLETRSEAEQKIPIMRISADMGSRNRKAIFSIIDRSYKLIGSLTVCWPLFPALHLLYSVQQRLRFVSVVSSHSNQNWERETRAAADYLSNNTR